MLFRSISTFGRFMERAFDEVEMAVISGLPINHVLFGDTAFEITLGISLGEILRKG